MESRHSAEGTLVSAAPTAAIRAQRGTSGKALTLGMRSRLIHGAVSHINLRSPSASSARRIYTFNQRLATAP
ncbi:hypothetical protein GCM10009544_03300 [Streptomyces stramineus]|uniref:Transposase n=1 Tax=Streptomyces stramineus TaxID=173861 RepID=A0ABN0ZD32_9ACTN